MSRRSTSQANVSQLKEKLKNLDSSQAQKNAPMNVMRELMPLIFEKQKQGFTLHEIYEVVGSDLGIKEPTFKTYYRQLKMEKNSGTDKNETETT